MSWRPEEENDGITTPEDMFNHVLYLDSTNKESHRLLNYILQPIIELNIGADILRIAKRMESECQE
jgi:hypothetical protein